MLWIDVTDTFLRWSGSPTGIQRTLLGLARASEKRSDCKLCVFDEDAQIWREIPAGVFENLVLGYPFVVPSSRTLVKPDVGWDFFSSLKVLRAFLRTLLRDSVQSIAAFAYQIAPYGLCTRYSARKKQAVPSVSPGRVMNRPPVPKGAPHPLGFTRKSKAARSLVDLLSIVTPFFIVSSWHRFCARNRIQGTAPIDVLGREAERRQMLAAFPPKEQWDSGERMLVADSHWNRPGFFSALFSGETSPEVLGFCYDLIPLDRPDFVAEAARQVFERWILEMLDCSSEVACISAYTAARLERFVSDRAMNLPKLRRIRPVMFGNHIESAPKGSGAEDRKLGEILAENNVSGAVPEEAREATSWMLWVGSLDVRKNLDVLLLAAEHCYSNGKCSHPLVIAGRPSTGFDYYANKIRNNPVLRRSVVYLDSPSDSLIADLHVGTMLYLFTSWEEGYGLPVAEALQLGIPVIASNATSIPEVAGPLVDYFDPWDSKGLADLLERFESDELYRQELRARAALFVPTSWDETLADLVDGQRRREGQT